MLKTAECVTPKHPDKLCDRISDAILDYCLSQDPHSEVAIEVMGGHKAFAVFGEITSNSTTLEDLKPEITNIISRITETSREELGNIQISVVAQSPEISQGVDTGGAGDQGIMVGYACNDNPAHLPQELYLARSLAKYLYDIYPVDGKTQITLTESGDIDTVVASFQTAKQPDLISHIQDWLTSQQHTANPTIHANPAGDWDQGGFDADTGLTGRKLAVDNYGPQIPLGGGAFSGKDATKVDRSGAYMARYLAIKTLNQENAKEVLVKLAYAIGVANPVMATAQITMPDGTTKYLDLDITNPELTPKGIIDKFNLTQPIFEQTAMWGHFGNNFPWDK
ncbi:MAG: methionine adenosyltransferase domain-containing protein [Patescibacteria group bacterium]